MKHFSHVSGTIGAEIVPRPSGAVSPLLSLSFTDGLYSKPRVFGPDTRFPYSCVRFCCGSATTATCNVSSLSLSLHHWLIECAAQSNPQAQSIETYIHTLIIEGVFDFWIQPDMKRDCVILLHEVFYQNLWGRAFPCFFCPPFLSPR